MSLTSEIVRETYTSNGILLDFAIPFTVIESAEDEVVVYVRDESSDPATEDLQVISTDYSLTGNPVDTVTFAVAPADGLKVIVIRQLTSTQSVDVISNSEVIAATTMETAWDRGVALSQQLQEQLDRSVLLPITSTTTGLTLPEPAATAYLRWNEAETGLENALTVDAGSLTLPGSSVDNGVVLWNGTGGNSLKSSVFTLPGDAEDLLDDATVSTALLENGAVTLAKQANLAANSIIGNNTGSAAVPLALTATQVRALISTAPTIQKFTSSSGTYTMAANVKYIRVRLVGGGGGGAGGGTAAGPGGSGGAGGNTTFGSTIVVGNGGGLGTASGSGGVGGTASLGSGAIGTAVSGGGGGPSESSAGGSFVTGGATGGSSFFGGAGGGGGGLAAGVAGATNSGSGGGGGSGGGQVGQSYAGGGGGAGGFADAIISAPAATYAYAVGAAGTAGTAGTSGSAGGAGAAGYIEVTEYYI